MVLTEPFDLRRQVAVQDIAFLILETPWYHDQRVSFPYPGSLLDLSFDPPHPGDTIYTSDPNMVCPEQGISRSELLSIPSLRQPDAGCLNSCRVHPAFETVFLGGICCSIIWDVLNSVWYSNDLLRYIFIRKVLRKRSFAEDSRRQFLPEDRTIHLNP